MPGSPNQFHVTPSAVARYFALDCDRYLRYQATPEADRGAAGIPAAAFDHSPLMQDVLEGGLVWEERVVGELLAGRVAVAPGVGPLRDRRFDAVATLDRLRDEPVGRYVYQATLRPPTRFYADLGLPRHLVGFGDCHPDLIEVGGEPGDRLLRVLDVKRGESVQLVHRVQILLYALILDATLREAGVTGVRADLEAGGVWLGDQPGYERFDLAPLRPYLTGFLREKLPAVLSAPADQAGWHVTFACERCVYFPHCRDEMRRTDDAARLTNITPHGKRHLVALGVRTLPQLEGLLRRPDADGLLGRCASLAGERHYIEGRLAAFAAAAPRPHEGSAPLPRGENVAVVLTLQREPLGRTTYLAGLLAHAKPEHAAVFSPAVRAELFDAGGRPRPYVRVADRPDAVTVLRGEVVRFLHAILTDVHAYNRGRPWEKQLSLQTYTHTDRDRDQLTAWLLTSLDDPTLAAPAMALLLHFQCPDLVLADEHPDHPVPYPVVVLQNVLAKTVALPVEVSYTLPEALAALGSPYAYPRKDHFHYPLGHGLRSEAIHAAWHGGRPERLAELRAEAGSYLFALRALLWAVRGQLGDRLFAWPPKFALPADLGVGDPLLSRLAFFTRYESVTAYLGVREGRVAPAPARERLGAVTGLRAVADAEFEVVGETATELEAGGPPGWLLSRATAAGRKAQMEFRDYASRDKMYIKASPHLALVAVDRVEPDAAGPRRVRLRFATKFENAPPQPGELFHLQPRFTDFTSDRVIGHLRDLDRAGGGLIVPLLRDPAGVARQRPLPPAVEAAAAAGEAAFGLADSQRAAYREVRRRRVVAVWGPPGTGKTHCLAAVILGLARAHAAAGKPFRVLVTAFTHAAIENLLRKVADLRGPDGPAVGKVKAWQAAAAGATVTEDGFGTWLAGNTVAVAGATVYSCLKAAKGGGLGGFDLVVVDEASQMRPAEASVPASLVAPDGRLVLAGDDLQLPPVVQGAYPDPEPGEPVLHRSVFEAVRSRLPAGSPVVRMLLENRRMNDVLTSFAAGLLYGPDYRCFDAAVAARRLSLRPGAGAAGLTAACLDPAYPLVVVVLDGYQAAKENAAEAALVADVVVALRDGLTTGDGNPYADDATFFRHGVFVVCPHRAQNHAVRRELTRRRAWASPPFVDTVDKMQGQEADAVVVSYGVADPEYALAEAEFIYSVNRLNVAVTRARAKSIVFLPRPLLDSLPNVLDEPAAERGLAYMRRLVDAAAAQTVPIRYELAGGGAATLYRAGRTLSD